MVRDLPLRASLENLRNQAKTLQKQHREGQAEAVARVAASLAHPAVPLKLHDAQFALAREYGFASWPKLVEHFEAQTARDRVRRENGRVWIEGVPRLRWGASPEPTYIGALEAAFRSSDRPLNVTTLMGDSGLAFRLRWATRERGNAWCGSGPCGEWPPEVAALGAATGYVFEFEPPEQRRPLPPEYLARITDHIDRGWPLLGFGKQMDLGVIFGYEAGGRWNEGVVDPDPITGGTYHYGSSGYERWIADLERVPELSESQVGNLWFLNGWTYSSLHMNRSEHAGAYLRANAEYLPPSARSSLHEAAQRYDEIRERLGKWDPADPTFGMVKQKKVESWTPEVRARELSLLRDVYGLEARAMSSIQQALPAAAP